MGTGDDVTYHDRKGSVHPFVTPRSRGPEGNQAGMRGMQGRMASSVTALAPRTTLVTGRPKDATMTRSMLIHRLEDERLLIFGGMWLEDFGPSDLEALGKPAFVVVTNPWHRLFAGQGFRVWLLEVGSDVLNFGLMGAVLGWMIAR